MWEALLRQSSFWGKGSPRPAARFKTEGVIRPQWSPNQLEDIHRTGGSQLWPECWSWEEYRQREKVKLPEEEPTFSRATGARPPACPPWRLTWLGWSSTGLELRACANDPRLLLPEPPVLLAPRRPSKSSVPHLPPVPTSGREGDHSSPPPWAIPTPRPR